MITLSLLHPTTSKAVQSWVFESQTVIQVGRAQDNDVVLYSAVVSRHHVKLCQQDSNWKLVSSGSNGTYLNEEAINEVSVENGMTVRLGDTGPKICIWLGALSPEQRGKTVVRRSSRTDLSGQEDIHKSTFITNYHKN